MDSPKYKILVVDDTIQVLITLQEVLESNGYLVDTLDNGLDAFRKASQEAYHLILLDIKLPKMDGVEAFEKIKEIKPEIPIVFISGLGHSDGGQMLIDIGAFAYLSKPLDLDFLLTIVKRALEAPTTQKH